MAILDFILHLTGATMLLLFAVRMVRTGIERSFGGSFQRVMTQKRAPLQTSFVGVGLAVVLQSSAAMALLVSGFVSAGYISFPVGLALVLGGDLGSALIIQVLSFDLEWLIPLLLAVGGWLFVKTETRKFRQTGRILLGIAFILISLRFLREAMDPIRDSAFLPAIANYLANDFITAFLVGAVLAFVMHSSVAAILMCVTLVQLGAVPFSAGVSLVLGANLGSAFIPVYLTRGMDVVARRVTIANLFLRGSFAVVALFAANAALNSGLLPQSASGQTLVLVHIGFNATLLLALPFARFLEQPMKSFFPEKQNGAGLHIPFAAERPTLDSENIGTPAQALSSIKKELLAMSELVRSMFHPVLYLYQNGDPDSIKAVQRIDQQVNEKLSVIRAFVASIPTADFGKENTKSVRALMEYAIRLETAGDVVAKRLMVLAQEISRENLKFSKEGLNELTKMHERILENLKLADNVLVSDDLESARLLSLEKTELKRAEGKSRKKHLQRLQQGHSRSFASSDVHLETLRALREFNSHIAAVAYPLLYKHGQLLETRLINELPENSQS